jgi:hypothetical protein
MFNIFNALNWLINGKTPNMNVLTANDYYDRLKLIAMSLFEWEGLPETCNTRHLEQSLYMYGRALFYQDPNNKGFFNAKCTPSGTLNHYDEPISYMAYSTVYQREFDRDNCVLIRNNYLERPTDQSVILFASRLTTAERTIDVNINAQKTPVLVRCDDKDRMTMKNLYNQYEGNEPFILGSKSLNPDGIKVFKTDAPFVADKLQLYKRDIWNEALTFFGINNANTEKRERLITDEVNANNEVININAQAMLLTRQEACEQINKRYGLNVSVKMRSFEVQEIDDENKGGEV